MDDQLYLSASRPDPEQLDPIENRDTPVPMKPWGGIWTSTLESEDPIEAEWLEWCQMERWGINEDTQAWKLVVEDDIDLYVIDGTDDLSALLDAYGSPHEMLPNHPQLDFEAMAEDGCDALRLTTKGQAETRFSRPGLYGWDCESTLFFDWCFESVEHLGNVEPGEPIE